MHLCSYLEYANLWIQAFMNYMHIYHIYYQLCAVENVSYDDFVFAYMYIYIHSHLNELACIRT